MQRFLLLTAGVLASGAFAACSSSASSSEPGASADAGIGDAAVEDPFVVLEAEPQRAGDPVKGRRALLNEAYVPCGFPYSAYVQAFGSGPPATTVEGREGRNAMLTPELTAFTTKDGVELVTQNCLACHAGEVNGKYVIGLGNAGGDFTSDLGGMAAGVGLLVKDVKERAEWKKWQERVDTIAPYAILSTRGPNPADSFTAVLFAHHDPKTLAWSAEPLLEVPPPQDVPVDVPPWWRMKKKASMFYVGGGRGDHARVEMTASILCTSSVEESKAIDAYFPDIAAYIESITPPAYPFAIDRGLADRGQVVFESTCSRCHGTYGASGSYPNKLVYTSEVGTDPVLASGTAQFAGPYVAWFAGSFFGELARLEPKTGYVAPPLDGIWATAPFLHNGSVPTIEALLDSSKRPTYWTRSFDSTDYDPAALGWRFTTVDHGKAGEASETARKSLYDTTLPAYGNAGHTYGDALSPDERAAVLEYLKTL